ncbi:hypothetical protein DFH28DRAFT_698440 [Melampsora americana]|nr:hypothetical protein DFH28DRAFT_698440 [Melampsora americana]
MMTQFSTLSIIISFIVCIFSLVPSVVSLAGRTEKQSRDVVDYYYHDHQHSARRSVQVPSSTTAVNGAGGTLTGVIAANGTDAAAANGTDAVAVNGTNAAALNGTAGIDAAITNATAGNVTGANVTAATAQDANQTVTYHAADASAGLNDIVTQLNATNQLLSGAKIVIVDARQTQVVIIIDNNRNQNRNKNKNRNNRKNKGQNGNNHRNKMGLKKSFKNGKSRGRLSN